MPQRVAILVFDGMDVIDSGGPYEVFLTASRLAEREGRAPLYDVVLVSPDGGDVTAFGGLTLTQLSSPASVGDVDLVVVPGLIDVERGLADASLAAAVGALVSAAPVVASVCTGAFLLARAGLLEDKRATTHWEDLDELAATGRVGSIERGVRWVDEGSVVTSAGLTSGMHMALHLVAREHGEELAARTARHLDLPWDPNGLTHS